MFLPKTMQIAERIDYEIIIHIPFSINMTVTRNGKFTSQAQALMQLFRIQGQAYALMVGQAWADIYVGLGALDWFELEDLFMNLAMASGPTLKLKFNFSDIMSTNVNLAYFNL